MVSAEAPAPKAAAKSLGVTIEAQYTVGEYDILILSAKESDGLETWLRENGYRIPSGASRVLEGYIKQKMRFFVAKVNLEEKARLGFSYLRPLQVAYESPKFMLPIRLGMANADGPQELFIYALTRRGRVETTNYRTVRLPSDQEIPLYVKEQFGDFYKALFSEQVRRERMESVFLEYAWDMGWCDPCAADPLAREELKALGVFWLDDAADARRGGGSNAFVTRLHVRYDEAHFPEDLVFQETADRQNFQGRYVLRHPFTGDLSCEAGERYRTDVARRHEQEAQNLANLTGWSLGMVRSKMKLDPPPDSKKLVGTDLGKVSAAAARRLYASSFGGSCERRLRRSARSNARRMSSSRSFESGSPDASQSRGYMEIAVKPGSVLSSLTRTRSEPRSRKKSTRAIPDVPQTRKASTASRRTSAATASGSGAGTSSFAPFSTYLSS